MCSEPLRISGEPWPLAGGPEARSSIQNHLLKLASFRESASVVTTGPLHSGQLPWGVGVVET